MEKGKIKKIKLDCWNNLYVPWKYKNFIVKKFGLETLEDSLESELPPIFNNVIGGYEINEFMKNITTKRGKNFICFTGLDLA